MMASINIGKIFLSSLLLLFSMNLFAVPVTIDPGEYPAEWYVINAVSNTTGLLQVDLEPATYQIVTAGTGSIFNFQVSSDGSVTSSNQEAAIGGPNSLTLNNVTVTVDTGRYEGNWYIDAATPGRMGHLGAGKHNVVLVPGLTYWLYTAGADSHFTFQLSADGSIVADNSAAATVGINQITFNNTLITLNPTSYTGIWFVDGASPQWSGEQSLVLVPGLSYYLKNNERHLARFDVAEPCAVTPGTLYLAGGSFDLRCDGSPKLADPASYQLDYFATDGDLYHLDFDSQGNLYAGHDKTLVSKFGPTGSGVAFTGSLPDPDSVKADVGAILTGCNLPADAVAVGNFNSLKFYSADGTFIREIIGDSNSNLQGMSIDPLGRLLIADHNPKRILTVDESCSLTALSTTSGFPGDIAISGNQAFVTAMWQTPGAVEVYNIDGVGLQYQSTVGGMSNPEGIAADTVGQLGGYLYVADRGAGSVWRFLPGATSPDLFISGLVEPTGITVGPDNCLYVSDKGANTIYRICSTALVDPDSDGDGYADSLDNCLLVVNPDQLNLDNDQQGDACDPDKDGDGIANGGDNCPVDANQDQEDMDLDQIGDLCDDFIDQDADGIKDSLDNCSAVANTDQLDADSDGIGDACDSFIDADVDGVVDLTDNCPMTYNPAQQDSDYDGLGDICDADQDNDGVQNEVDACSLTPTASTVDINGCSGHQAVAHACGAATDHKNHGQYVSCVARHAQAAMKGGFITNKEKAALVKAAATQ